MNNVSNTPTNTTKPAGNTDPEVPNSPDVQHESWSAEEIAEQASTKDGTEVKQEIQQGQKTQRQNS